MNNANFFKPKDFDPGIGPAGDRSELCNHKKTALLVNIQPIQKDTAESLLQEIVEFGVAVPEGFRVRARKLLEDK